MEVRFRTSLPRIHSPLDWINRPNAPTILAIIVAVLVLHVWSLVRHHREKTRKTLHA